MSHVRIVEYYNIVDQRTVLDKVETRPSAFVYFCMEYMPGGSLYDHLQSHGPLTEKEARIFTRQLLEGIDYLHEKAHIIHFDVRASNILMNDTRHAPINIKICDFGSAKKSNNNGEILIFHKNIDQNRILEFYRGKMYWMSPEVAVNNKASIKSDIWSVGCTVIEMLTSDPPWYPLSEHEVLEELKNKKYPTYKLQSDDMKISDDIELFLRQCFETDPVLRPSAALLNSQIARE